MKKRVIQLLVLVLVFAAIFSSCKAEDEPEQIVTVSKAYPRFNLTELAEGADLIIKGTVTGQSDPFKVKPSNGGDISLFSNYFVDIEKVYRGDAKLTSVDIRVQGGELDGLRVEAEDEAQMEVDGSYIFFCISQYQTAVM